MITKNRSIIVMMILALSAGYSQGPDLSGILDSFFSAQARKYAELKTLVYRGNSVYRELSDGDSVKKITASERVIYQKGRELQTEQYVAMSVDGKALTDDEMEKQVADWQKKGRKKTKGLPKMPFYPEIRPEYEYELLGSDTLDGYAAWKIGFKPRSPSAEHLAGTLWVVQKDFDIIRMESKPSKMSSVVKKMELTMEFRPNQGYWLPHSFFMAARIKVKFLVTLANVNFTVEDRYFGFSINPGIPDSVFKK